MKIRCRTIPANINPRTWGIPRFPRTRATINEKIMTVPTSNTIIRIEISLEVICDKNDSSLFFGVKGSIMFYSNYLPFNIILIF